MTPTEMNLIDHFMWGIDEQAVPPCSGHAMESQKDEVKVKYASLEKVLTEAYQQAAVGKGAIRHAAGKPFDEQPMQKLCELYGVGFALGQAAKKMQESTRMPADKAVHELLGAINYIAGAVIHIRQRDGV
jgi:hypothetical protein